MNAFEISMLVQIVIIFAICICVVILDKNNIKNKINTYKSINKYIKFIKFTIETEQNSINDYLNFMKYFNNYALSVGCTDVDKIVRENNLIINKSYMEMITKCAEFLDKSYKDKLNWLSSKDNYYGLIGMCNETAYTICKHISKTCDAASEMLRKFQFN